MANGVERDERRQPREYRAPTLTEYGPVAKLTLGASGSVGDGVAGMNMVPCL